MMKPFFRSKFWSMLLVSLVLGVALGLFDATSSLTQNVTANAPDECPDGVQCKYTGCGPRYCIYNNIYGLNNCPSNRECPNIAE